MQPAPACPGYIVVNPDTFGHFDAASGHFINTDSGIETEYPLRRPGGDSNAGLMRASAASVNPDLGVMESGRRQPTNESVAASNGAEIGSVNRAVPPVDNGVWDNHSNSVDSAPVTNYAVIVGMDNDELDAGEHSSLDGNSTGRSHNAAGHLDNDSRTLEELEHSRTVSDEDHEESPAVPFGIGTPAVCYSLNSGGYLSHSELLGAAPAM